MYAPGRMTDYAIRVRVSWKEFEGSMGDWGLLSRHAIAYEHPEPGNIHCHVLLTGVHCSDETLKNVMRGHNLKLKGNKQWSFKQSFKNPQDEVIEITPETWPKYISYMSKGKYDPKYVQGFSEEIVADCKAAWVDYTTKPKAYLIYLAFANTIKTKLNLTQLKIETHVWCMAKYKSHTPQMRKEQSQLIDDYCFYNDITKEYKLPYQ